MEYSVNNIAEKRLKRRIRKHQVKGSKGKLVEVVRGK